MIILRLQFVNNTADGGAILGAAPTRITQPSRSTNRTRLFARSRNPDADTHTQVPTSHVSLYGLRPASISRIA